MPFITKRNKTLKTLYACVFWTLTSRHQVSFCSNVYGVFAVTSMAFIDLACSMPPKQTYFFKFESRCRHGWFPAHQNQLGWHGLLSNPSESVIGSYLKIYWRKYRQVQSAHYATCNFPPTIGCQIRQAPLSKRQSRLAKASSWNQVNILKMRWSISRAAHDTSRSTCG